MRIDRLAGQQLGEAWSLQEDIQVLPEPGDGRALVLKSRWGEHRIHDPGPDLREALRRMSLGPVSLGNVVPDFPGYDTDPARCSRRSRALVRELTAIAHLVDRTLMVGARPLLTVVPETADAVFAPRPLPGLRGVADAVLVPGLRVGHGAGGLLLSATGARHRVELHRPEAAWLVGRLRGAHAAEIELASRITQLELPATVVAAAVAYLVGAALASVPAPGVHV